MREEFRNVKKEYDEIQARQLIEGVGCDSDDRNSKQEEMRKALIEMSQKEKEIEAEMKQIDTLMEEKKDKILELKKSTDMLMKSGNAMDRIIQSQRKTATKVRVEEDVRYKEKAIKEAKLIELMIIKEHLVIQRSEMKEEMVKRKLEAYEECLKESNFYVSKKEETTNNDDDTTSLRDQSIENTSLGPQENELFSIRSLNIHQNRQSQLMESLKNHSVSRYDGKANRFTLPKALDKFKDIDNEPSEVDTESLLIENNPLIKRKMYNMDVVLGKRSVASSVLSFTNGLNRTSNYNHIEKKIKASPTKEEIKSQLERLKPKILYLMKKMNKKQINKDIRKFQITPSTHEVI